jgi:hypothetical protein
MPRRFLQSEFLDSLILNAMIWQLLEFLSFNCPKAGQATFGFLDWQQGLFWEGR